MSIKKIPPEYILKIQHDIRAPISNIVALIDIVASMQNIPKQAQEYVNLIKISSKKLMDLVTAAIRNYSLSKNRENRFNITKLIQNAIKLHIVAIKNKNLNISLYQDPNVPTKLIINKHKLYTIIINLLDNAIKFTELHGKINIIVKLIKTINPKNEPHKIALLELTLENTVLTGAYDNNKKLNVRTGAYGNNKKLNFKTSLGFSIIQQLINDLGAEIYITSNPKFGTKFKCILPCKVINKFVNQKCKN